MHIAVIIPAYNVAPWLRDCLLSLQAQTSHDWTATIVDDGSTDATSDIASSLRDPRMILLRQVNAGVSAARNLGLSDVLRRDPDAILFLDADDWLAPDALDRLQDLLEASPWAVAASGSYARMTETGGIYRVPSPPEGCLIDRLLVRNLFVNGGHLLIRREAIEQVGFFREDLSFGEDWQYWTRLALLGEFVSLRSRAPVMFLRERSGSAYHAMATDPRQGATILEAIFDNPALVTRLGSQYIRHLRARAEAEHAWVVGRELIRHGNIQDGRKWLARSLRDAPSPRRLALVAMSRLRAGPFRPYGMAG